MIKGFLKYLLLIPFFYGAPLVIYSNIDSVYNRISIIETYECISFFNPAYLSYIDRKIFIFTSTLYNNSDEFSYIKEWELREINIDTNNATDYPPNEISMEKYQHPENEISFGVPVAVFLPFKIKTGKFVLGLNYEFEKKQSKDIRKTKKTGRSNYYINTNGNIIIPDTPTEYLYESVEESRNDELIQFYNFLFGFKIYRNSFGVSYALENNINNSEQNNKYSKISLEKKYSSSSSSSFEKNKTVHYIKIGDIIEVSSKIKLILLLNYNKYEYNKHKSDNAEYFLSDINYSITKEKYNSEIMGGQIGASYKYKNFLLVRAGYSCNYNDENKYGVKNENKYKIYNQKGFLHQIQLLLFIALSRESVIGTTFIYYFDKIKKEKFYMTNEGLIKKEDNILYNKFFKIKIGLEKLVTQKLILRIILNQKYTKEDLLRESYYDEFTQESKYYKYQSDVRIEGESYFTVGAGYKILENFLLDGGITFNSKKFYIDIGIKNSF